jgi:diamine N-acetyltransferase
VTLSQKHKTIISSPFLIRVGTLSDAPVLTTLGAKTFYDTFAPHNTVEDMKLYLEKNFTLEQVEKEINDPASTFLLALDGQSVVGYAKLRNSEQPKELGNAPGLEIERIYSAKEYVGKKVGKTLMLACLAIAEKEGFKTVWLGVWEHNPKAIAFYERWGFEKYGSHPFMLGSDAQTDLLMKKNLT